MSAPGAPRASAKIQPLENVPLASRCTLGVGGPARFFAEVADEAAVREALRWAQERGLALHVLGGGSNIVVSDAGVDGLVVKLARDPGRL